MSDNLQILLVEDDIDLAKAIVEYFAFEDIQCDHASNGVSGLHFITHNYYEVIILDINLPKKSGLDVCKGMRELGIDTPVLMLTARDTLDDKVVGFSTGADDYLVKPFAMEELIIRTQVLSRRRSGQMNKLVIADLEINLQLKSAKRGQQALKLSPTAFKILECLMRESPNTVSREKLLSFVWGDEQPDSNNLKVHMFKLRKAIEIPGQPTLIQTIAGYGFALKLECHE
ncbi:MAG: response regulator transcription factor [Paraglaciecola sp.]|uniref:response regulator transcription factor n=1 Tax=Paraglaciecola sp. TaxID=1920173 RepID=UPI00329A4B56